VCVSYIQDTGFVKVNVRCMCFELQINCENRVLMWIMQCSRKVAGVWGKLHCEEVHGL
jgi:hypothetical protein